MTLSILIPTYNRSDFLQKNLELLCHYIGKGGFQGEIEIIVSNNNSSDNTDEILTSFSSVSDGINLRSFSQKDNIGLERNSLFILEKAENDFVMYLGDDDFITFEYLQKVLHLVKSEPDLACIIPSFIVVDTQGEKIKNGRDTNLPSQCFPKGFKNCYVNSWRGHQMSGLVLKRQELFEVYRNNNVSNIYPFIFFVAYSTLVGTTYHLTENPVKVTDPGQEKKDWKYSEDGLLLEVFDNYIKLPLNSLQITRLQLKFIGISSWRLWGSEKTKGTLLKNSLKLLKSNKTNWTFKVVFPAFIIYQLGHRNFRQLKSFFK